MITGEELSKLSRRFGALNRIGVTLGVSPWPGNPFAQAARAAGMGVTIKTAAEWPFPGLIRGGASIMKPELIGQEETARHDALRNMTADSINAVPGGAAVMEVPLTATLSKARAVADIIARAPVRLPGAAQQAVIEVKTGSFAEIKPNQRYIYGLALIGNHLVSEDSEVLKVGLSPDVPLPAMDFVFVGAHGPDWTIHYGLILASSVNRAASIAEVIARVVIAESVD